MSVDQTLTVVSDTAEGRAFRLIWVLILIALIAVGLRVPVWLGLRRLRGPDWWETYWREQPVRDAWAGPVWMAVRRDDDLRSMLRRVREATEGPELTRGLLIYVDDGALMEAGWTLFTPLGVDLDSNGRPARDFLQLVLKPHGLASKLQEGKVMVSSEKSIDEPIDYGRHGEVFCSHGERWVISRDIPMMK